MLQRPLEDPSSSSSSSSSSNTTYSSNVSSTSSNNPSELRRLLPQPVQPSQKSSSAHQAAGASSGSSSTPSSGRLQTQTVSKLRARAKQVDIACEACRKHKVKCTAERPRCRRCSRRDEDCHYEVPEFSKDRYDALKKSYDHLVSDRESCQQLFGMLETAGSHESQHILGQIREGQDATSVLKHVREANLLVDFSGGTADQESAEGLKGGGR